MLCAVPTAYQPTDDVTLTDGDTITASVLLTHDIRLTRQAIRAANYDAWESRRNRQSKPFADFTDAQWAIEQAKGEKAKQELAELLASGELYVVLKGRDVYGRLLGEFWVYRRDTDELVDVAKHMAGKGHVRK